MWSCLSFCRFLVRRQQLIVNRLNWRSCCRPKIFWFDLFRRYPGSDLLQIEHLKRLCTRGIVKAQIEGGVLVAKDVGSIVLGQDLQIAYLTPDAAHENFAVTESLVLKIEAPDAICTITPAAKTIETTSRI
jgi:uncharacterized linocin/CFP29 family protein